MGTKGSFGGGGKSPPYDRKRKYLQRDGPSGFVIARKCNDRGDLSAAIYDTLRLPRAQSALAMTRGRGKAEIAAPPLAARNDTGKGKG